MAIIETDQKACGRSGGDLLLETSSDIRQHFVNKSPYAPARPRPQFLYRHIGRALMFTARLALLRTKNRTEFLKSSSTAFWVDLDDPYDLPPENNDTAGDRWLAIQTLAYMVFNKNCGDDEDSTHQDTETTSSFVAPSDTHVPRSVEGVDETHGHTLISRSTANNWSFEWTWSRTWVRNWGSVLIAKVYQ